MDTNALMCVYNIVAISVSFLVMRTYTVYVLYLSTCTYVLCRDGDYENIFADLSRFPEVLKEKLVS